MEAFLKAVDGSVSGITMVNGISRPVLHRDGRPVFGEQYLQAGVLGRALHEISVTDVRRAVRLVRENELALEIVGVGGVSTVADAEEIFNAGAAAVMLGSSPMYLPELAVQMKKARPDF